MTAVRIEGPEAECEALLAVMRQVKEVSVRTTKASRDTAGVKLYYIEARPRSHQGADGGEADAPAASAPRRRQQVI